MIPSVTIIKPTYELQIDLTNLKNKSSQVCLIPNMIKFTLLSMEEFYDAGYQILLKKIEVLVRKDLSLSKVFRDPKQSCDY